MTDDAFNLRLAFRPAGKEIRPGVWASERTHIHRTARIVAPVYIGNGTKIRAAALVTRGSSIEHHCEVDCGTVVQASNVLPFTYLGAGLELLHSVAGARHVANAAKKRTAEINDPKLMRELSGPPAVRMFESAGSLASFLPRQIFRTFLGTIRRPKVPVPDIAQTALSTRLPAAAESALAAGIAATSVTRDHGNE
jgi:NDP-sugar pyrophosphorylase family protein